MAKLILKKGTYAVRMCMYLRSGMHTHRHTPTEPEPDSPLRKGKNKIKPSTVDRISAKQFSITSHVTAAQRNNKESTG